jgi:hypothetical protein
VHFAVQLLAPPVSDNWGGNSNGLLAHAPMLYAALQGMNNADAMNVLSLFGMVRLKFFSTLVHLLIFHSVSICIPDCVLLTYTV